MKVHFHILFLLLVLFWDQNLDAQFTNIRVSKPSSTTPEEVTIAVNPVLPGNLIAGANLRFGYVSTDTARTWNEQQLPSGTYGDPCVMFDVSGNAYFAHLTDGMVFGSYWLDRLTVHLSTDGGMTWPDTACVGFNPPKQQDKEWLACDATNSKYRNNIYMAWTEFDLYGSSRWTDSSRILFSRSTDHGKTWMKPVRVNDFSGDCIDSDNTVEGAVPSVGPNGEVYLAWSGPLGLMFDKSTDAGTTWGKDTLVAGLAVGWDFNVPGIYRCNGLPMTACDVSNSAYRGTVYILWSDQPSRDRSTNIYLIKSGDGGQHWSGIKKVNTDQTKTHHFFPSMAIDQTTGNLYVVFYDRRAYTDSLTDVYLARSSDGGETFTNMKISQSPFGPTKNVFFGDYIHVAAANRMIYPIWMRLDNLGLSVWTARIPDALVSVERQVKQPVRFELSQNFPNPFNPSTRIRFLVPAAGQVTLKVFDRLGREVQTLVSGDLPFGEHDVIFYGDNLATGVYFYQLTAGQYRDTKKFVLLK